jgi:hypothetical protein
MKTVQEAMAQAVRQEGWQTTATPKEGVIIGAYTSQFSGTRYRVLTCRNGLRRDCAGNQTCQPDAWTYFQPYTGV